MVDKIKMNSLSAGTAPGLVLWVDMQLEVLLDAYLTWQLLLQFKASSVAAAESGRGCQCPLAHRFQVPGPV